MARRDLHSRNSQDLPAHREPHRQWFDRHTSQAVCRWNQKFATAATEPAFTPIAELAARDDVECVSFR